MIRAAIFTKLIILVIRPILAPIKFYKFKKGASCSGSPWRSPRAAQGTFCRENTILAKVPLRVTQVLQGHPDLQLRAHSGFTAIFSGQARLSSENLPVMRFSRFASLWSSTFSLWRRLFKKSRCSCWSFALIFIYCIHKLTRSRAVFTYKAIQYIAVCDRLQ